MTKGTVGVQSASAHHRCDDGLLFVEMKAEKVPPRPTVLVCAPTSLVTRLRRALAHRFQCKIISNGADIVVSIRTDGADAVLIGFPVPGVARGGEILAEIRRRWRTLPMVVLGGAVDADRLLRTANRVSADACYPRPFDVKRIRRRLVDLTAMNVRGWHGRGWPGDRQYRQAEADRKAKLVDALGLNHGSVKDVAQRFEVSRMTLYRWMRDLGLDPRKFRKRGTPGRRRPIRRGREWLWV